MSADARLIASQVIRECRRRHPSAQILAFGSASGVTIGVGRRSYLISRAGSWAGLMPDGTEYSGAVNSDFGDPIGRFLDANCQDLVIGYIGFEGNVRHVPGIPTSPYPSTVLAVPETLIEVDSEGRIGGTDLAFTTPRAGAYAAAGVRLSSAAREEFTAVADAALRWIDGRDRRATVCVRSDLDVAVDLPATFSAGLIDDLGLAQSFYAWVDGFEFVGTSPELLLDGSLDGLVATHKLSGTFATRRTADVGADSLTLRILKEHEGTVEGMTQILKTVGFSEPGPTRVMRVGPLSHLLTSFETKPYTEVSMSQLLLALLPSGAAPRDDGLALIAGLESHARGPYYGLFGVCRPSGRLRFCQTLRAALSASGSQWVMVGAAVTRLSTAELEAAEIALKASSIMVVSATTDTAS